MDGMCVCIFADKKLYLCVNILMGKLDCFSDKEQNSLFDRKGRQHRGTVARTCRGRDRGRSGRSGKARPPPSAGQEVEAKRRTFSEKVWE